MLAFSNRIDAAAFNDYLDYKVNKLSKDWSSRMKNGVIITNKDAVVNVPDDYIDYSNTQIYDMLSLEDISLSEFIAKSIDNIVIKIGEQFYAFDRKVFIDYMKSKRVWLNDCIGYIFETPYRQFISSGEMALVSSNVYRIYELYDESRMAFRDGMVSLYDIKPYAVIQCLDAMLII